MLNVISQTMVSSDHSVPLLLKGSKGNFGTYRDVVHNNQVEKDIVIGIGMDNKPPSDYQSHYGIKSESGYVEMNFSYKPKRHIISLDRIMMEMENIGKAFVEKPRKGKNYYYIQDTEKKKYSRSRKIENLDHFLPIYYPMFGYGNSNESDFVRSRTFHFYMRKLSKQLKLIESVGPFRVAPNRTYMFTGEYPQNVGIHGENTIDILTMDYLKQKRSKEKKNILLKVIKWFNSCGMSNKIDVKILTDRHYEIVLSQNVYDQNNEKTPEQNIVDVGFGCSQVLPVLVGGFNLDEGGIFIVEEPEIHLHPKAQAELGTFFYNLSKRNIQTFIETHSEHLLLRLQAHIADPESSLNPEDVNVYCIYFDDKNVRRIMELSLGENGFFNENWPRGFFPERLQEAKKIAKRSVK